jgi:hypothetical protein
VKIVKGGVDVHVAVAVKVHDHDYDDDDDDDVVGADDRSRVASCHG